MKYGEIEYINTSGDTSAEKYIHKKLTIGNVYYKNEPILIACRNNETGEEGWYDPVHKEFKAVSELWQ